MPLLKNMENTGYIEALLESNANLEELSPEQWITSFASGIKSQADIDRIFLRFQASIKLSKLAEKVILLCTKSKQKSNPK